MVTGFDKPSHKWHTITCAVCYWCSVRGTPQRCDYQETGITVGYLEGWLPLALNVHSPPTCEIYIHLVTKTQKSCPIIASAISHRLNQVQVRKNLLRYSSLSTAPMECSSWPVQQRNELSGTCYILDIQCDCYIHSYKIAAVYIPIQKRENGP